MYFFPNNVAKSYDAMPHSYRGYVNIIQKTTIKRVDMDFYWQIDGITGT